MKKIKLLALSLLIVFGVNAQTWSVVTNPSTQYLSNTMVLLNDGSVLIKTVNSGFSNYNGKAWNKLTPDITGDYKNGTWSLTDTMHYDKVYFGTTVRSDGRVLTGKGMYFTDSNICEVYNPSTNTWTFHSDTTLLDNGVYPATITGAPTGFMKLANGTVSLPGGHTLTMFTPIATNTYPYWVPQSYLYKDNVLIAPPLGTTYAPFWAFASSLLALPDGSVLYCAGGKHPFIYK